MEAHKYMSYSRDASGIVTRNHRTITLSSVSEYHHRETLLGWPERFVFWQIMADGSAEGIAPMTDRVLKTIKEYTSIDYAAGSRLTSNQSR